MTVRQDLSSLWLQTVRKGVIASQFSGSDGRPIQIGLRLVDERIEHYARYLDSGEMIGASIEERPLERSGFALEWNRYRALKPHIKVTRPGPQPDVPAEADRCLFSCLDASHPLTILRREPLLQLSLPCNKWVGFYNAVPVEPLGHYLWVPVVSEGALNTYPHEPQILTEPVVRDMLAMASATTGAAIFYNSLHAGASVNHIHFHTVHEARTAPLMSADVKAVRDYLFLENYPAQGLVFPEEAPASDVWQVIATLQENNIPLNVVAVRGRTFVFPRKLEHEAVEEFPDGVIACAELSGKLITTREDFFARAQWPEIGRALDKTCLSVEEMLAVLR
jgi:hypothetical protein